MNIWDTQLGTDFIRTMLDFFQKKAEVKQYTVTANRLSMKDLQEIIDAELAKELVSWIGFLIHSGKR